MVNIPSWNYCHNSINLSPYNNLFPFIAPDESYLIFTSDRKGNFGGGDLYISFHNIDTDTWTEPINMGAPINTDKGGAVTWTIT